MYEIDKLKAKPLVEKYCGEYLARGGRLTVKESKLWAPTRMVLIRFPSAADAETFYVRPAGRTYLEVKVLYSPDKGKS